MKRAIFSAKRMLVAFTTIMLSQLGHSEPEITESPYYAFLPSEKGEGHKRFVHHFFGFSIDIPKTWVFGINGVPPTAVVFVYPEGLNSGKFSKDYETIEISQLPFADLTLDEAQKKVMKGMRFKHPKSTVSRAPKKTEIDGTPAISWVYQWPSKTGFDVTEYITLLKTTSGTRSLAVRTTRREFEERLPFYDEMIKTFKAFKPKH